MPTVYCASIECKRNNKNKCTAKVLTLNESHLHTVWNGVEQVWRCKQFEMSEEAKRMKAEMEWLIGGDGHG